MPNGPLGHENVQSGEKVMQQKRDIPSGRELFQKRKGRHPHHRNKPLFLLCREDPQRQLLLGCGRICGWEVQTTGLPWWLSRKRMHLPIQETWLQSLDWEDPLEKEMAAHSSILAWKSPWTEEPGGLQSIGSQRVRHDWTTVCTQTESL